MAIIKIVLQMKKISVLIFTLYLLQACSTRNETPESAVDRVTPTTASSDTANKVDGVKRIFDDSIFKLPKATLPVTFNDNYYLAWPEQVLPYDLAVSAKLDTGVYKVIGVIEFPTDYIILVKEHYNNRHDFIIHGLSFNEKGTYCCEIVLNMSSDSDALDFAVTPEYEIKVLSAGPATGVVDTYVLENGRYIKKGERQQVDDVDEYTSNN